MWTFFILNTYIHCYLAECKKITDTDSADRIRQENSNLNTLCGRKVLSGTSTIRKPAACSCFIKVPEIRLEMRENKVEDAHRDLNVLHYAK